MQEQTAKHTLAQRPQLWDVKQAAAYLGISPNTLNCWRCSREHDLPYLKLGRLIRYRQRDLDAWLASRVVGA